MIAAAIHFPVRKTVVIRRIGRAGLPGLAKIFSAIDLAFGHAFPRHPGTLESDAARPAVVAVVADNVLPLGLVGIAYDLVADHAGIAAIRALAHHSAAALHPLPRTGAREELRLRVGAKERGQKANDYGRDKSLSRSWPKTASECTPEHLKPLKGISKRDAIRSAGYAAMRHPSMSTLPSSVAPIYRSITSLPRTSVSRAPHVYGRFQARAKAQSRVAPQARARSALSL
jgi:hypothetical protein